MILHESLIGPEVCIRRNGGNISGLGSISPSYVGCLIKETDNQVNVFLRFTVHRHSRRLSHLGNNVGNHLRKGRIHGSRSLVILSFNTPLSRFLRYISIKLIKFSLKFLGLT